jgi:uncharacterized pyridoxal phosphate-containing UPF0001 family protein
VTPIDLGALAPSPPAPLVAERVSGLRRRIAAGGRDPATVRIVAVTKGFGLGAVDAALAAGLSDLGENRAEELLAKAGARPGAPGAGPVARWHYLGAIQRRRVPALAAVVGMWETVARLEEGVAIAAHAPGAAVLVQVDPVAAPGHNGCALEEAPALVDGLQALDLDVRGLMVLAPQGPADSVRHVMRAVAQAGSALGLDELSMGMTDDVDLAIAEGATIIRIGRGLFGERPPPSR